MSGWRQFDQRKETVPGASLWVHESGTDQVELITCDENSIWRYEWGGELNCGSMSPDLCHDVVPPALPDRKVS